VAIDGPFRLQPPMPLAPPQGLLQTHADQAFNVWRENQQHVTIRKSDLAIVDQFKQQIYGHIVGATSGADGRRALREWMDTLRRWRLADNRPVAGLLPAFHEWKHALDTWRASLSDRSLCGDEL